MLREKLPISMSEETRAPKEETQGEKARLYWKKNLRCLLILLGIWFLVSFGFGILLVDVLDRVRIPGTGFKLGFWFAQQGSIYVFLILIAVYVRYMNKLDQSMGVEE